MSGYLLLLRWQLLRQRSTMPLLIIVQIALGMGVIYGLSFLVPHVTPDVALYLATGAPTLGLVMVGLTFVPQETVQARLSGRQDYLRGLPVGPLAPMLCDVTFWLAMQLPGMAATLALAALRFGIHLHADPLVVPAVLLVALTAAAVGYSLALSLPPTVAQQVTSFLSIGVLLFSPIDFPLSRLPTALQDIHRVLPITYMADVVRGSLTGQYGTSRALAFGVLAAWCAVGLTVSARAAVRSG